MSALANFRGDRRIRAFGPYGVLWRRRFTLEKAEQHVRLRRAVAERHPRTGRIKTIHFFGDARRPLSARYKPGAYYSHLQSIGERRAWTHNRMPSVPVANGLSESEFLEQVDLARRLAFQ